jgi:predicted amidophosphoribosyltransferase
LSRLILWLKGRQQRRAWHYYAEKMAQYSMGHIPEGFKIYIVPAPAKRRDLQDHAYLWAEGLAQALGAEIVPCLEKVGEHHQRGADRGTRALIEMQVIENSTENVDFGTRIFWIFADDIVTTGSTARSAHIALGGPQHFEVWALAQRSLSCGASK